MSEKKSKKSPAARMTQNFFLHIHSPRIYIHSLRPGYTLGLGAISAFLFLILLFTGIILMLYYTPSVERAYASVKDIIFVVPGGRLIRNMHRWAGHGLVLAAFLHLVRVFYTGSYLRGRTLNWIIGIAMLVVVLFSSFSGYLLPWDQLAYWAVTIGSNIAASFREFTDALALTAVFDSGGLVKKVLIGGETVGQPALSRFFLLHVVVLPLTLIILMGVHFWRIRRDGGLSRPEKNVTESYSKVYAWPHALWAELAALMLTLAVLLLISTFFDAPLREQANPLIPENPAKSPWYFLGIQELVSYSAFSGGILIPLGLVAFFISIPFKDRQAEHIGIWFSGKSGFKTTRHAALYAGVTTVALYLVTINFGWLRDWIPGIPQLIVILINPATVVTLFYALWATYILKKTKSRRHAALALFTCVMIGYIIFTIVGVYFRGPNWEFFWLKSQWPVL